VTRVNVHYFILLTTAIILSQFFIVLFFIITITYYYIGKIKMNIIRCMVVRAIESEKIKSSICYSAFYSRQTCGQKRFDNFGSSIWLAWANDTAAHYVPVGEISIKVINDETGFRYIWCISLQRQFISAVDVNRSA